jgi:hypothetical protein
MRAILESLLIIAVTFVYVAGPYATVEMAHSHGVCQSHGHQHTGDDHDHSHHPDGHSPVPSSDPDSDEPDSDSHSHTHVVTLGADILFTAASHNAFMVNSMDRCHPAAILEFVPDEPSFDLNKPPQLG